MSTGGPDARRNRSLAHSDGKKMSHHCNKYLAKCMIRSVPLLLRKNTQRLTGRNRTVHLDISRREVPCCLHLVQCLQHLRLDEFCENQVHRRIAGDVGRYRSDEGRQIEEGKWRMGRVVADTWASLILLQQPRKGGKALQWLLTSVVTYPSVRFPAVRLSKPCLLSIPASHS